MQLLLFILAFVCHFHNHNSDVLCSVVGNHFFPWQLLFRLFTYLRVCYYMIISNISLCHRRAQYCSENKLFCRDINLRIVWPFAKLLVQIFQ